MSVATPTPQSPSTMRAATRVTAVTALLLLTGFALGLALDANAHIPAPWNRVSSVLGWTYFACWSASFYPQVLLNHARRSVRGLSLDYVVLGLLGFACYAVFNCAFYFSDRVQQQYAARHGGHRNAVEINDVLFGLHASLLTTVSLVQSVAYKAHGASLPRVSRTTLGWTAATLSVAAVFGVGIVLSGDGASTSSSVDTRAAVTTGNGDATGSITGDMAVAHHEPLFTTLNFLYYLSFVKLVLTVVKYIPQVVLNCRRKSTAGWAIENVYLDIAGGVFSIAQQVLDSAATNDWGAITGDPVKFALALVTMSMDAMLLLQHYVLYPERASVRHAELQEQLKLLV